ncbi:Uncharacterised protein [Mycobacterium tuberculosis]|nr:Uncharacterised protein [Mycobacterium tuberculosis]CFS00197.1 Uncharacterised protein [Mycobacterium tuberculosis]CFS47169.1 Uncharacterised protein [Mycobacterium tuberculosis]CKT04800.1 Uncharacterised protein [Mycobacterium tuberculosis]CKT47151.1 Uncharacterised protein [Mycobacterium tuberculosis]
MMWLAAISGSDGVVAMAWVYAAACAVACIARVLACVDAVCSQTTIGVAAASALSLPPPVQASPREFRRAVNSTA